MIFRYDQNLQRILKSKVKPEPWLHCALYANSKRSRNDVTRGYSYAIYVWDTRQVLDSGWVPVEQLNLNDSMRVLRGALDNREPLKGSTDENVTFISRNLRR